MRVVIDTNVFVSSFFGGKPREIIDLWIKGVVILCLSREIIDEYFRVLRRMGLAESREFDELVSLFAKGYNSVFTSETPDLDIIKKDPDDNKFLECAVALEAEYIISGDRHITNIGSYMTIACVTPSEFLAKLGDH